MHGYVLEVPDGWVAWFWSSRGLYALSLPMPTPAEAIAAAGGGGRPVDLWPGEGKKDEQALVAALQRYFQGAETGFDAVPLDWTGYSAFTRRVLQTVRRIPRGRTLTYGEVAAAIGEPRAARAVGNALGRNRTPLVVPCHRVIAANGKPGGWSGPPGWKERLLLLEQRVNPQYETS